MIPLLAAIAPILGKVFGIVDKMVPDKDAAAKAKHEIETMLVGLQGKLQNGQIEINKIEAAHKSIFVAGWRPAIGWVCALSLGWHFLGYEAASWFVVVGGWDVVIPKLGSTDVLMELVLAMLGLAGFRTFEKFKGISREK
jgi:hypothetical protein